MFVLCLGCYRMKTMVPFIILVLSLVVVVKAADWFLSSAEKIGVALKLSPFILGMILVGFGTSLPELATSLAAIADNSHNVMIANVIGSNLVNIFVTLGVVSFLMGTIHFKKDLIDLDLPLLAGATVLFGVLVVDGRLTLSEAVLLLIGFVGYLVYALLHREGKEFHKGLLSLVKMLAYVRRDKKGKPKEEEPKALQLSWIVMLLLSLALLAVGSRFAVNSAIEIAQRTGILVDVVTFFAIAVGTSLPEVLVSLRAVWKGNGDIALGNVIGSSIFNLLMIGGVAGAITDQFINPSLIPWLVGGLGVSALLLTLSGISKRIYAWEGLTFLLIYAAISMKVISL